MPLLSEAKTTGGEIMLQEVWFQASRGLGCFPEMVNSKIAMHSSFLLQNSLGCCAIIILSCQDDTLQTSLQNFNKPGESTPLSPLQDGKASGYFAFTLIFFSQSTGSLHNFCLSGNSPCSLFGHVERVPPFGLREASWAAVQGQSASLSFSTASLRRHEGMRC